MSDHEMDDQEQDQEEDDLIRPSYSVDILEDDDLWSHSQDPYFQQGTPTAFLNLVEQPQNQHPPRDYSLGASTLSSKPRNRAYYQAITISQQTPPRTTASSASNFISPLVMSSPPAAPSSSLLHHSNSDTPDEVLVVKNASAEESIMSDASVSGGRDWILTVTTFWKNVLTKLQELLQFCKEWMQTCYINLLDAIAAAGTESAERTQHYSEYYDRWDEQNPCAKCGRFFLKILQRFLAWWIRTIWKPIQTRFFPWMKDNDQDDEDDDPPPQQNRCERFLLQWLATGLNVWTATQRGVTHLIQGSAQAAVYCGTMFVHVGLFVVALAQYAWNELLQCFGDEASTSEDQGVRSERTPLTSSSATSSPQADTDPTTASTTTTARSSFLERQKGILLGDFKTISSVVRTGWTQLVTTALMLWSVATGLCRTLYRRLLHPVIRYVLTPVMVPLFHQFAFSWFTPVLLLVQRQLQEGTSVHLDDNNSIPPLPDTESAEQVLEQLLLEYDDDDNTSLLQALWKAFSKPFVYKAGVLKLLHDILQFIGPQVLHAFIQVLRRSDDDATTTYHDGLVLMAIVTIAQIGMAVCIRQYFWICYRVGIRVQSSLSGLLYRKVLLTTTSSSSTTTSNTTNLMAIDVPQVAAVIPNLHALWYSFLQVILALFFLWREVGASCLAGVATILLSLPLSGKSMSWQSTCQTQLMTAKDARVQSLTEGFSNVHTLKVQAWESAFLKTVQKLRTTELSHLRSYLMSQAVGWMIWAGLPLLIALATFGSYILLQNQQLDVATALTSLALLELLRFPLYMLPRVLTQCVQAQSSLTRIRTYLNQPNHTPLQLLQAQKDNEEDCWVSMQDASFAYASSNDATKETKGTEKDKDASSIPTESDPLIVEEEQTKSTPVLQNISLDIPPGQLIAVVGAVGAGKSSLLKAMLGELTKTTGTCTTTAQSLAYCDQTPFLVNDTIRNNILFGSEKDGVVDEALYQRALQVTCLTQDLEQLPHGDETELGERGVNLSGGQKARVCLARAVYSQKDVTLLDDVLAAVDASVARHLFEKCIVGTLLQSHPNNSVVLVTNAIQYLSHPAVSTILVLNEGRIVERGTYSELVEQSSYFAAIASASAALIDDSEQVEDESEPSDNSNAFNLSEIDDDEEHDDEDWMAIETTTPPPASSSDKVNDTDQNGNVSHKIVTDELAERAVGQVKPEIYWSWIEAAGGKWTVMVPLLFLFSLAQCINVLSNWWLTHWSHAAAPTASSQTHFLELYGLINIGALVMDLIAVASFFYLGLQASQQLFDTLLTSCLYAPLSFFHSTPTGRLLNRFSQDLYTVDETLPSQARIYLQVLFQIASTLIVISYVTPQFLLLVLPVFYCYRKLQLLFAPTVRELKRLELIAKSPIQSLLQETLAGIVTIRAYHGNSWLTTQMYNLINRQQHMWFLSQVANLWVSIRLELLGTMIIGVSGVLAVLFQPYHSISSEIYAGLAGLSLSYALTLTQYLAFSVRCGSVLESHLVSVERLHEYSHLTPEGGTSTNEKESQEDASAWPNHNHSSPSTGPSIVFQNASLRYRPGLPLVLQNLNLTLPAGSKIGIVGRTGAGKSTLFAALLRLVELEDGGSICIDGVDISKLSLQTLRSNIAVIPQDPVLFAGTIQSNLDPFQKHSREQLERVLERVGLLDYRLEDVVSPNGSNYSAGQRQLLVIARALVQQQQVSLVLCDEATAAVDVASDAQIQKVLQQEFKEATTLTIAHRLNTIQHSDYLLVLEDGRVAAFDTPGNILANDKQPFAENHWEISK